MSAPPPLVLGNWKMNLTVAESVTLARDVVARLGGRRRVEAAVAPAATALAAVAEVVRGGPVGLAAQNAFWEDSGPYTGEVSPVMLQDIGVAYVILGHSERRRHLLETDLMVAHKVRAALRSELKPVVCVGETEDERAAGHARRIVRTQLLRALEEVPPGEAPEVAVAYEPVWAIGTGRTPGIADIADMHAAVRGDLEHLFGSAAASVRVLYGGSVTPANSDDILALPGVGGLLVGGASLRASEFARIASPPPA